MCSTCNTRLSILDFLVPITIIITDRRVQTPVPECAQKEGGGVLCLLGLPCAERMVVLSNLSMFCCFPHYTSYRLGAWVINQNIYVSSLPVFAEPLLSVVVLESLREGASFILL